MAETTSIRMPPAYEYDDRMSITAPDWWEGFFDDNYLRLWASTLTDPKSDEDASAICELLALKPGNKVLDAPCGFGRLTRRLAARGVQVVGMDASQRMIDEAERHPVEHARYVRHDLREPLPEAGFDAAFNVFSSIGYAGEEGDRAAFRSVHAALRPGGLFLVESRHRDDVVLEVAVKGLRPCGRFSDGTIMFEEMKFDPVTGQVDTVWHFAGPRGASSKLASYRMYSPTELVALLRDCGFRFVSAFAGLSTTPFGSTAPYPRRVAVLCERV